jgi:hypothetical protein
VIPLPCQTSFSTMCPRANARDQPLKAALKRGQDTCRNR